MSPGEACPALRGKHIPFCFSTPSGLLLLKYLTWFYRDGYSHTQASAFGM